MVRKIINDPDNAAGEMMEGFIAAYERYYRKAPGGRWGGRNG